MKLQHLKTFVTVADEGTVSKAAQRLRIAQPALSRQIGDFEGELGLRLFDRVRHRLVLTGEGERLLADCRSILAATDALGDRARLLGRSDAGVLKVAAVMLDEVFATFLHRYAARFPNVQVKLSDSGGAADLFAKLESGEVHLGIGGLRYMNAENRKFENFLPLPSIQYLAAGHASLPLGSAGHIEVADLGRFPLLLLVPSFQVRRTFDDACRVAGIKPRILVESRIPHTLLALAEAGHGVAIGPSTLPIHRYRLRVARVLQQGKLLEDPLIVISNGQRTLPRYARSFCEMLEAYMREVFPTLPAPTRKAPRNVKRAGVQRK